MWAVFLITRGCCFFLILYLLNLIRKLMKLPRLSRGCVEMHRSSCSNWRSLSACWRMSCVNNFSCYNGYILRVRQSVYNIIVYNAPQDSVHWWFCTSLRSRRQIRTRGTRCRTPTICYTKVDVQCHKLATVVDNTCDSRLDSGENI